MISGGVLSCHTNEYGLSIALLLAVNNGNLSVYEIIRFAIKYKYIIWSFRILYNNVSSLIVIDNSKEKYNHNRVIPKTFSMKDIIFPA